MSQPPEDRDRPSTVHGASSPLPWVNLAALLLAAGGLFLPWITGSGRDRMGVETDAGLLFATALFITVLLTGPQVRRHERQTTWALVLSWYALLAVAVFETVRLSALSADQGSLVHIGPGLYCCTLAAAVGTAAATLATADRWLAQCADPWMKTRTPWLPSVAAGTMLAALPFFGLLGHAAVRQPAVSVTAHRVAPGTRDGSIALGATPATSATSATGATSTTSAVATPAPSTPTSAANGNTGNTGLTGPGDLLPTAMDSIWPGYTGDPGTSYVWPGYLVPGNTGATGNSGLPGATGVSGTTGNTGAPLTTTSTVVGAATSMQTPPGVSSEGGSGNSEAAD
jgi:hypothetical protein